MKRGGGMKKETWVVVANSTQARIFKLNNLELIEIDAMIHPASRMHERDLIADRPGTAYAGVASGRYGLEQQSPKKNEAIIFSKQLIDRLDNARSTGQVERLFLAATPSFLGLLRQGMNQLTTNLIAAEVDKDITDLKPDEIISYFPIGL
jgi:protein required for attachment to host cells